MARKGAKGRGKMTQPRGEGIRVRIAPAIVAELRYLAARRAERVPDLVNRLLEGPVDAMFRRAARDVGARPIGAGEGGDPGQGDGE
jgi:hypothetical protein